MNPLFIFIKNRFILLINGYKNIIIVLFIYLFRNF